MFSLGLIFLFTFVIASPDILPKADQEINVNPTFVEYREEELTSNIVIDTMSVEIDESSDNGVLKYVVQPWDVLGKIASTFGTTVSKIKSTNKIDWPIKPGQVIVIVNNDVWFLYTIPETINVKIFTNTYNLNNEEFMSLNYIQDESEMLYKGQDVFVNITDEQAYQNGLLERPKPVVVVKPTVSYKPVINRPQSSKKPSSNSSSFRSINGGKKSSIISQRWYKKNIKNGFYAWYCTWYVAIISPNIFPYTDENTQSRPFNGNATQRCANAKEAWLRVVWNSSKNTATPLAGDIVVYHRWWPGYSSYGHVAKVKEVHTKEWNIIVEEMNYVSKFVVSVRKDSMDNSNIKCYIRK